MSWTLSRVNSMDCHACRACFRPRLAAAYVLPCWEVLGSLEAFLLGCDSQQEARHVMNLQYLDPRHVFTIWYLIFFSPSTQPPIYLLKEPNSEARTCRVRTSLRTLRRTYR